MAATASPLPAPTYWKTSTMHHAKVHPRTICLAVPALIVLTLFSECSTYAELIALPESNSKLTVLRDGQPFVNLEFVGWGKNWSWMGFRGDISANDGETIMTNTATSSDTGARIKLIARIRPTGKRQLTMTTSLSADKATELTYIVASLTPSSQTFEDGSLIAVSQNDERNSFKLPLGKQPIGVMVRQCELVGAAGSLHVAMQPPRDVTADGAARIVLAAGSLTPDNKSECSFTLTFPEELHYYASSDEIPSDVDPDKWFVFEPDDRHDEPSEIGMQDWLERPAGRHGRIKAVEDELIYNNLPIKLWGLNLCYSACAPDRRTSRKASSLLCQVRCQFCAPSQVR